MGNGESNAEKASVAKTASYQSLFSSRMTLKKIKVYGDFVYPQCIRKGKGFVCKPKGKRYKFRSYSYVWIPVDDKALAIS